MRNMALGLIVLFSMPLVAQQSVPEIPFESVADFLQLPDGINFGHGSRRARVGTSPLAYGQLNRQAMWIGLVGE